MIETIPTISQRQRASMSHAVMILAQREAIKEVKAQLRHQGLKPQHYSMRELVELAKEYLTQHRAELINEAKVIVER